MAAAAYLALLNGSIDRTLNKYFELNREADDTALLHVWSATQIQRLWRGYIVRKSVKMLHKSARDIQRIWRGFKCRQVLAAQKRDLELELQAQYYHYMATQIQRVWRGYVSRSLQGIPMMNYYKRKQLLAQAYNAGEELKRYSEERNQELERINAESKRNADEARVAELAKTFHHLSGTASIQSVFASPYGDDYAARIHVVPMDTRLRLARKEVAKEQMMSMRSGSKLEVRTHIIKKRPVSLLQSSTQTSLQQHQQSAEQNQPSTSMLHYPLLGGSRAAPIPLPRLKHEMSQHQTKETPLSPFSPQPQVADTYSQHVSTKVGAITTAAGVQPTQFQSHFQSQTQSTSQHQSQVRSPSRTQATAHSTQQNQPQHQQQYYLPPIRQQSTQDQSTTLPSRPDARTKSTQRNMQKRGSVAELNVTIPQERPVATVR